MNKLTFIIFINTLLTLSAFAEANAYVIASNSQIIQEVSPDTLKEILTGKKVYWESGDRIKLCHVSATNSHFKKFLQSSLNMNTNQYLNLWRRKLFTGRGFPPTQVKSDMAVINCVKENEAAIGITSIKPNDKEIFQLSINL